MGGAHDVWAGIAQVAALVLLLVVAYRPLGDWMATVLRRRSTTAGSNAGSTG